MVTKYSMRALGEFVLFRTSMPMLRPMTVVWSIVTVPRFVPSSLDEIAAKELKAPVYEVVGRSGAHHAPRFTVRVSVRNLGEAEAEGSSKQEAETAAAAGAPRPDTSAADGIDLMPLIEQGRTTERMLFWRVSANGREQRAVAGGEPEVARVRVVVAPGAGLREGHHDGLAGRDHVRGAEADVAHLRIVGDPCKRAITCSGSTQSPDPNTGMLTDCAASARDTISADAPARTAVSRKSWASKLSPRSARKTLPARMVRESVAMPVTDDAPRGPPPSASAMRSSVQKSVEPGAEAVSGDTDVM